MTVPWRQTIGPQSAADFIPYIITLPSPNLIVLFTYPTYNLSPVLRQKNCFPSEPITLYLDSSLKWTLDSYRLSKQQVHWRKWGVLFDFFFEIKGFLAGTQASSPKSRHVRKAVWRDTLAWDVKLNCSDISSSTLESVLKWHFSNETVMPR